MAVPHRPPTPARPPAAPAGRPPPGGPLATTPLEALAFAALSALIAAGALLWAAGQLAARVTSGVWLPVSVADLGAVVFRLLRNPSDPAGAWPPEAAVLLPGPIGFWAAFAVVALLPLAGLVLLGRWRRRRRTAGEPRAASWAARRDLQPLRVHAPTPGRLTLGRAGRALLAAEARQSLIVIGPTQSGKTTGLAVPAILEWDGPVVATSVKADLLADTLTARRARGRVWTYDPTGTAGTGGPSASWTPLAGCQTWQDAQRVAAWLVDAGRESGLAEADFWYATAAKLLAPLLFAAASSQRTMADVVRWVDTQEEHEVRFELEAAGVVEAIHAAVASWQREERQRSSVYTTAETVLRCFADPAVAATAETCDITPEALLDGGAHTLYVCAPSHEQARLRPLLAALLQQTITACYERANTRSPLARPLLVVFDEAANIAPLPNLDTIASTAAGVGVQLVTVWQDLAQIQARYSDRAATVVNNHRAKLALSGISDPRTLEYFSRLVGDSEVARTSTTTGHHGQTSRTEATHFRRLASDDALRQMTPGEGLLVYGHLPPTKLRLRPWYTDRRLRQVAEPGLVEGVGERMAERAPHQPSRRDGDSTARQARAAGRRRCS